MFCKLNEEAIPLQRNKLIDNLKSGSFTIDWKSLLFFLSLTDANYEGILIET